MYLIVKSLSQVLFFFTLQNLIKLINYSEKLDYEIIIKNKFQSKIKKHQNS